MKRILFILCLTQLLPAASGYLGAPGEESHAIVGLRAQSIHMMMQNAGVADQALSQTQVASMDPKENISLSYRPGLLDEHYGSMRWIIPFDKIQFKSQLHYWDQGEIDQYTIEGVDKGQDDQPIAVYLQQGLSYRLNSQTQVGAQLGVIYQHLSHLHDNPTSAAVSSDWGLIYSPSSSTINYGLEIRNWGHSLVGETSESRSGDLNTQIQAGVQFRNRAIPRLKWNIDYLIEAYNQSSIIFASDFQINSHLQAFLSSQVTQSRWMNLWHIFQGHQKREAEAIEPLLGTGFKFRYMDFQLDAGFAYIPLINQVDLSLTLIKSY